MTLRDALKLLREQRGFSKSGLSQSAGLSASYIGKLESGVIEPSVAAFAAIALALQLTPQEILFCVRCALVEARS